MNRSIRDMRNLGPRTETMLAEVDIVDEGGLRAAGAVVTYRRLKFRFGRHVSLLALYAMEAALSGKDWRDIDESTKERLRAKVSKPG